MNEDFNFIPFNDGIALKRSMFKEAVLVYDDVPIIVGPEGKLVGNATTATNHKVNELVLRDLKRLPWPLYILETLNGPLIGTILIVLALAFSSKKLWLLGIYLICPYFKSVKSFLSTLINNSKKYKGKFKKTRQHTAAINMVKHAYNDLKRIPTLEESKKYEMTDNSKYNILEIYIGYTYLILIGTIVIAPVSFIEGLAIYVYIIVVFLISHLFLEQIWFRFFEKKSIETPEENDILLVIFALQMREYYASTVKEANSSGVKFVERFNRKIGE